MRVFGKSNDLLREAKKYLLILYILKFFQKKFHNIKNM